MLRAILPIGREGQAVKEPSVAPMYACLYPGLAEVARGLGYALAIHGSMVTDLDLIAVPWREDAVPADALAFAIQRHCSACLTDCSATGNPEAKPHGRKAWHLSLHSGACIDLSVTPTVKPFVRLRPVIVLSENERLNLEMAAHGCISGDLSEWPVVKRALEVAGCVVWSTTKASDAREMAKLVLELEAAKR